MADHIHACNICSSRWDCDSKQCRNKPRGVCFWCLAQSAGKENKPQVSHDHEWAGGDNCSICTAYNRAVKLRRAGK